MLKKFARRVIGTKNDRLVTRLRDEVEIINQMEDTLTVLDDSSLKQSFDALRQKVKAGTKPNDIRHEVFAIVREAARRTLGQRHFDEQLIGGLVLHSGKIAEMRTGEGKTLAATLPAVLNALSGGAVHVVTVNDYLARRDSEWMGKIYDFLGLTVGCVYPGIPDDERRAAYAADIMYGVNSELGFDYLRDNMKHSLDAIVQRGFAYAIVDEVDSILIDEARTPLIISGAAETNPELYQAMNEIIPLLSEEDYEVDEKQRSAVLTEIGSQRAEALIRDRTEWLADGGSLYDLDNISVVHHLNQALRAHLLFSREKQYMVKEGRVVIVDEFTGRSMEGRRFSDGLHQALEAKEGVKIEMESQTLASITYQNYFRMYDRLAGMTGTALTEAAEFESIYGLEVVEIPTHREMIRLDQQDQVYRSADMRDTAVVEKISESQLRAQPVLVGTTSIERSETISKLLKKAGIKHYVLNARHHSREAEIIAEAGAPGAVTVATNMAGRGTDIQLGGNLDARLERALSGLEGSERQAEIEERVRRDYEEGRKQVIQSGGLFVLGTERNESRRVDNQLRGRSGRQGDPGESGFYVSLEDDLMRIFGGGRLDSMLARLGLEQGEALVHPWISAAIEKAQTKVEEHHFEIRKHLLSYDDVVNDQRKVIFRERRELLDGETSHSEIVKRMREDSTEEHVRRFVAAEALHHEWDLPGLERTLAHQFGVEAPVTEWGSEEGVGPVEIRERISDLVNARMMEKERFYGGTFMRRLEHYVMLQMLDHQWKEHLMHLEQLRQGIGLRAFAQRDPLNEYKREAYLMFHQMMDRYRDGVVQAMCLFKADPDTVQRNENRTRSSLARGALSRASSEQESGNEPKVGRNEPCPCGSGKKYKRCHGALLVTA